MTDEIAISHLQRRKIEGRVLIPFIDACREKFGEGPTRELVAAAICSLATADGARLADMFGADIGGLRRVAEELWAGGGGMEVEVIDQAIVGPPEHWAETLTHFALDLGLSTFLLIAPADRATLTPFIEDVAPTVRDEVDTRRASPA